MMLAALLGWIATEAAAREGEPVQNLPFDRFLPARYVSPTL